MDNGILLPKSTLRKKCSSDREKLLKFEAECREFTKNLRSLEQFVRTVKGENNFWLQGVSLTCSWRFLRSNKFKQLQFRLEKIFGFGNMEDKLEKKACLRLQNSTLFDALYSCYLTFTALSSGPAETRG